jgi:hypothetical protein
LTYFEVLNTFLSNNIKIDMGTIETTNNNILNKIGALNDIIKIFTKANISIDMKTIVELQTIEEAYDMESIQILSNYFLLMKKYKSSLDAALNNIDQKNTSENVATNKQIFMKEKETYYRQYHLFIKKENFSCKLDRLYNILKNKTILFYSQLQLKNVDVSKTTYFLEIKQLFTHYENSTIDKRTITIGYNICPTTDCGKQMLIKPHLSEILCTGCGYSKSMYGTVFEDDQFYFQEGQRTKHGSYEPAKHCRYWVERIQAREMKDIPKEVINVIKKCTERHNMRNLEDVTCKEIRKYLRISGNSIYNEHVPLIRKIITGISPPQLTDNELQKIHVYFDKVAKIYEEIKPASKTNCPYHPYFIYKIIEHIMKGISDTQRTNEILRCIHLQSCATLVENDKLWKQICNNIGEITYCPTDRNAQYDD